MLINQKKVSLVIPGYKPQFFLQTLKSALGQSYNNYEIIVLDNCPGEEIKNICSHYPIVKYFRNVQTGHQNILDSLYGCGGDYIKPLFDDDILHPFCLDRMVSYFSGGDFSFIFSASQVINIDNYIIENRTPFKQNVSLNYNDLARSMLLNFNNFVGELSSVMINRAVLNDINYSNLFTYGKCECTKGLADVAAFINLSEKKDAFYINEVLSYFRKDARLNSNSKQDPISNPNFKFAITDWVDLLIQGHIQGVVTDAEILERQKFVSNFLSSHELNYPEVIEHNILFSKYIEKINNII